MGNQEPTLNYVYQPLPSIGAIDPDPAIFGVSGPDVSNDLRNASRLGMRRAVAEQVARELNLKHGRAPKLNVYFMAGCDWYVAESEEEAWSLWSAFTGEQVGREIEDRGDIEVWPDERPITIHHDDAPERSQTAAQWVAERGKGFLCSTEW